MNSEERIYTVQYNSCGEWITCSEGMPLYDREGATVCVLHCYRDKKDAIAVMNDRASTPENARNKYRVHYTARHTKGTYVYLVEFLGGWGWSSCGEPYPKGAKHIASCRLYCFPSKEEATTFKDQREQLVGCLRYRVKRVRV